MVQDFFTNLPSEIITDILSRLSFRSISISKCVCKSWLNLLESDDFEIKTPPSLVCLKSMGTNLSRCTISELEDEADLEGHNLHYFRLTDFDTPNGSRRMEFIAANGLLLLYPDEDDAETPVYLCDPLTRKYIVLCRPKKEYTSFYHPIFDFCMSKISGQYKVVYITFESDYFPVYTLGTRIWRRVETGAAYGFRFFSYEHAEYNGNIHWLVKDLVGQYYLRIRGFDVETECFRIFSTPPALPLDVVEDFKLAFTVLRDYLCICYTRDYEIVIWLMKEYRVEESWTIEYKLSTIGFDVYGGWVKTFFFPIKVFKGGDVYMLLNGKYLIYYSNKTRTTQRVGMFNNADAGYFLNFATIFTPSLFSLKSFGLENVMSF